MKAKNKAHSYLAEMIADKKVIKDLEEESAKLRLKKEERFLSFDLQVSKQLKKTSDKTNGNVEQNIPVS